MNELIDCVQCFAPGVLRLDMHPPSVEHHRRFSRSTFCTLPPRDVDHPEARYKSQRLRPARAVCSCDTRVGAS